MSDIVERLRSYASDDHERLCQGREYSCTCGYDAKRDPLLAEAAAAIALIRAETLEEAAKEADKWWGQDLLAAAIRALKEKS